MCKHLRSIKLSAGNGSCKKPGPFFYLSPCHCTRPWDFYNPNWYSQGNLFHCSSLPWKDSFSCGHFSSPGWITATGVAFLTLPWQGLCLANLNLSYFAPIHLVLFDLSAPVCGFTDHFLITLPLPAPLLSLLANSPSLPNNGLLGRNKTVNVPLAWEKISMQRQERAEEWAGAHGARMYSIKQRRKWFPSL